MVMNSVVGKAIRRARLEKGMTQTQLSEMLHVTPQAISNWEKGVNRPDEDIRKDIENILGIRIAYTNAMNGGLKMNISPLEDITRINELLKAVDAYIEKVEVDQCWSMSIRKLLKDTLLLVLGYDCYYMKKTYPEDSYDWLLIASDLGSIIEKTDKYPIPHRLDPPSQYESMLLRKIEWMMHQVGFELFEDFDEKGYRNGYIQQVGRIAETCGYDLLNVLPDIDCSYLVSLKVAVLSLVEIIQSSAGMRDGIVSRVKASWDEDANIFPG